RNIVEVGARLFRGCSAAAVTPARRPIRRRGVRRGFTIGYAPLPFPITLTHPVEQRIALELPLHIGGKIEIGELQQLDGLHHLRRHHERMALPDFEALGKRHVALTVRLAWPAADA